MTSFDMSAGRKMGHCTVLGDTLDQALKDVLAIRKALGIG
jgi:phosphoribosylaminoimidazole carboxylase (NCAIR synthetase)